jgi:RNA polymerase sigma-70 factor, ECF subfamily
MLDVHVLAGPRSPLTEQPPPRGGDDHPLGGVHDGHPRHAVGARARLPRRPLLGRASDARLVELARAGDQRAFEVIIERYRPLLLAHCRSVAGEASQDAVQQACMSAWCALRRGQEVRDPRAWLFTIAQRAALRASQRPGSAVDELDEAPARARSPEEQIEQSGRVRATLAAVAGLPPRERDALVWASIQGRSGRDIARALGVSEAAARQLVFRARARARAAVSGLVPPALIGRLPASGGRGARRALALVQGGLANASPMEASEALARLAPVLAAVVLVTAPVAAVELSGRRGARARTTRDSVPGQGQLGAGRARAGPPAITRAARLAPALRAAEVKQPQGHTDATARLSQGGTSATLDHAGQRQARGRVGEQRADVALPRIGELTRAALAAPAGRALRPATATAGRALARETEALAPAAAATQDAGRRASGAESLLPQPPGGLEALQPRPPQAAPGASAPTARTLP